MFEPIAPLITAIKNAGPPAYAAALVASASILFLPDTVIGQIGLAEFRTSHRSELGAVLIGSASLLVVHVSFGAARLVRRGWKAWRFDRNVRSMLGELTEDEKEFLRPLILGGENTRYASIYDGVASGLQAKGIVYRASSLSVPGTPGMLFPWNLQPFARKALTEDPYLLS